MIDFKQGLSILTGETGAGKSIILDALCFVMGARFTASSIKDKTKTCIVSAVFDVTNLNTLEYLATNFGISDNEIIIKRFMNQDGKGKVTINGTISTVTELKSITKHLVEICGQHDQYGLFNNAEHIIMLDDYIADPKQRHDLAISFKKWQQDIRQLNVLLDMEAKSLEAKSNLSYIIDEANDLNIGKDEEEKLEKKKKEISLADKFRDISNQINSNLSSDGGVLNQLYLLQKNIGKLQAESFQNIASQINEAALLLEEVVKDTDSLMYETTHENIDDIENRLFKIKRFLNKHSIKSHEIDDFISNTKNQLLLLESLEDQIVEARNSVAASRQAYLVVATMISRNRQGGAISLQSKVLHELKAIKMDKADFLVQIIPKKEVDWSIDGIDQVQFLIKTNPGTPFGQIASVASGGELSRIMLACKIAMNETKMADTLIFDEIDSGIGGSVASSVGRKLSDLSKSKQVLLVTHQPQVATFSDNHYLVAKHNKEDQVVVSIKTLQDKEKIIELARMLSGDNITKEAIEAAKMLSI